MAPSKLLIGALALTVLATDAGATFYLYAPSPATAEQARQKREEEVAVREVTVARGDTLKRISRRFTGRASYFPQILLFTRIANPDLIHPGQILRVPVAPAALTVDPPATVSEAAPAPGLHPVAAPVPAPAAAVEPSQAEATATRAPATQANGPASAEQALFAKAVKAANKGKYRLAITTIDRLLTRYPASTLTPDAALFRADCYLKLSQQQSR